MLIVTLYVAASAAWLLLLWCVSDALQGLYRASRRKHAELGRWSIFAIVLACVTAGIALLPMYFDGARPPAFPFKPVDLPGYILLIGVCAALRRRLKVVTAASDALVTGQEK